MTIRIASYLAICALACAQPASQNIATGQGPMAVAVNEATGRAYVINHGSSTVTVIDGKSRTAVATVKTGAGPEGLAVDPSANRVYIANPGDGTVTVIDGATDAVVATVRTGSYPQAVAVDPVARKIYVANNYGHNIAVIDGATNQVTTVRVGQGPRGIVANSITHKIYTVNYGSKDATEIDGTTNTATPVPTGKHPWAIALDSRSNKIYVVNEDSASISIIDGATGIPKNVTVGEMPFAVAANPATRRAYVLTYQPSTLAVVDSTTGNITKTLLLADEPSAIAVNPVKNQIYIASQKTARVLVVDGVTNNIIATVPTGDLPYAMAVDTVANQVYVANMRGDSVTVIHDLAITSTWPKPPKFRVLAIAERGGGDHQKFVDAATVYLNKLAVDNDFAVDYINGTERINDESLTQYKLFIQLNYPPYRWAPVARAAFEKYITEGKGGWIGFHHAGLLGDFDGYPMDPWFSQFLGGIRFTHYLPDFANATVKIDDPSSPLAKGLPPSFVIDREEWYTWSQSPRPNVSVLASVDESSYVPNTMIKMGGDHPVVWSNSHFKARNVYIFMGHHGGLFDNPNFVQLFRNAIFWGAGQ